MCVIQIASVSLSALLAVNLQPTTVMPTKQQRARLKRLSRQLQFDHPGVRTRLDSPSSRRDRRRAPRQNAEQHVYEAQPFFILSDDTHRLMLAELRGGAAHVYSYLGDPRTTPQGKNVLSACGSKIERLIGGARKPVYGYSAFMSQFSTAESE